MDPKLDYKPVEYDDTFSFTLGGRVSHGYLLDGPGYGWL